MIDRDGSGSIDLRELQDHVNSARAFTEAFGTPQLSDTEAEIEPAVVAVFNSIDVDGDGIISKSEFEQAFLGQNGIKPFMSVTGVSWDEVKRAAADTTNTDAVLL